MLDDEKGTATLVKSDVELSDVSHAPAGRLTAQQEEALQEIFRRILPDSEEETERFLNGHRTEEQGQ
jgi:hypothetical protein